jgi:exodeoxyribonuclease-3
MRIVSWNVNSVHRRLPRVLAMLARHRPDVVCLQEIRTDRSGFPTAELTGQGYQCAVHGQPGRNGVAILSRQAPADVLPGFRGDPVPEQARVLRANAGGLTIVNSYVVNGRAVGTPEYTLKLAWLDAYTTWLTTTFRPGEPLLLVGDFNIAPDDRDVHDPVAWQGLNLCSEPERQHLRTLFDWGLSDLTRLHHPGPGPFTFWDYQAGAFHRGWGLRLDLALGTGQVARRCTDVQVDRDERKPTSGEGKPSDHAPLVITLGT